MALVMVYDKNGQAFEKEPVDARECVDILSFTYEKPEVKPEVKPDNKKDDK